MLVDLLWCPKNKL